MSGGLGLRRSPEMSGKLEKADSQRSHLSSFTMKLMDKFHSPKIKRTPSKKGKPAEVSVKNLEKPVSKNLSWLEEKEKEVVSALRYFKTIVDKMAIDKKVLEMLPGSASKVLEAILPLVQSDPRIQHSSALSSCYSRVYQSLANLIRWSDQVMLEGVNSEDKETVTTVKGVIKAVLDGVKVGCRRQAASLLGVCHTRPCSRTGHIRMNVFQHLWCGCAALSHSHLFLSGTDGSYSCRSLWSAHLHSWKSCQKQSAFIEHVLNQ